jgi:putative ABC transport system substrate-binding protein
VRSSARHLARAVVLTAVCLAAPELTAAQQSKPPRVGIVWIGARPVVAYIHDHFVQGMRELGWIDGQNVVIEARFANDKVERLPSILGELIAARVDVLVAPSPTLARAAKEATAEIPIVMTNVPDPVALGLVASVRRPGGNVTGVANAILTLAPKCAQLIQEILPGTSRLAALINPTDPVAEAWTHEVRAAAGKLGFELRVFELSRPGAVDAVLAEVAKYRPSALQVGLTPGVIHSVRLEIGKFGVKQKRPIAFCADPHQYVFPGVLFAYGTANAVVFRRVAAFVDRILKGARPGDLPVDHVEKVDFHVSLKTAKALGLTIPQPVLYRADRVIE